MTAEDVFQSMNCKATSIEEDGDKVFVIWKDNIWRIGSVISRSLKVVIGSDERVMRVVKENLGD